jgi:putative ABC transport system permease protein
LKKHLLHSNLIFRQLVRSRRQALVFVLCVALSIVTFISLSGFAASVDTSMRSDAKTLHAADIIIGSSYDLTPAVMNLVGRLEHANLIKSARIWEFYSVVRSHSARNGSLLAKLKVVQPGYPHYGRVELQSGHEFSSVLTQGSAVVAQILLDRLQLRVGDRLHVGSALLTIKDVVLQEPDQPVSIFSLGPRVFVSAEDLDRLDLVKQGSRVWYSCLIKVAKENKINSIADQLRGIADEDQERVDTFRTARSGVKRFFDNLLFFLSLICIFTLLLAGIGIQSTLAAFLKEKEKTIAIMKTIGASGRFFARHYIAILSILGFAGTVLGLLSGFLLQGVLGVLFAGLLPGNLKLIISWKAGLEGFCLGVFVVGLFSFIPLHRLRDIKPVLIFRKARIRSRRGVPFYASSFLILIFFFLLVLWQVKEIKTGLYFAAGMILLILIAVFLTGVVLFFLKRLKVKSLIIRQAIKGLFRPRNATKPIIITLTASLAVVFAIYLIEQNLDAAFIRSYPSDAPNAFFLDIQPSQLDRFSKTLDLQTEYYPIIKAKILAINGEKIDRRRERQRRGDNLARTFNLTYRSHLLEDEVIVKGKRLYREEWGDFQVSVMDTVADIHELDLGDRITFKIQGVPLQARVSSIRSRTRETLRPFFYFVFPEKTLRDAPQTIFTAVKVPPNRLASMQTKMVEAFPNVSVIDVSATLATFTEVMRKLSLIIRFFAGFSMAAGLLIILSSLLATRFARIQEAVYFKILGARNHFVLRVFALEHLFLGLVSASLALALSQIGSWIITSHVLSIAYRPLLGQSCLLIAASVLLVVAVGLIPSISILRQKPVIFLREQTQE